jgi:LPPG:FO 2-phospho-L-lactate transferase
MLVALAGGVGGAKLAHGLYRALGPDSLTVVVNSADDFDHFGLRVCPDADTVTYTLAGLANPTTGWGVVDDTFETLAMLARYGHDPWFKIGDRDFATHISRTQRLRAGESLTSIISTMARSLGVRASILPMCDAPVATSVVTPEGSLDFQEYFVHRHHADTVTGVAFAGIEAASVGDAVADALRAAEAIVFCPSNPIVSIGPILAVPGMRALLTCRRVPRVAVSPIVGGQALRGPADQMLRTLGHDVSAVGVAAIYRGLIDAMVIDEQDASLAPRVEALGMDVLVAQTIMRDEADREALARRILELVRARATP